MQPIRLIAIDLDGTLLNEEKQITPRTLQVLRSAIASGVKIALASGRRFSDVSALSEQIAPGQPIICANGAAAYLTDPFECVYCETLSKADLRSVVQVLEKEKCYYHVYCDDGSVMESRTGNPGLTRKLNCYDYQGEILSGDEMPKYVGDGALKVVCFEKDREKLARVRAAAEKIGPLEINSSWWDNIEVLSPGVNKGSSLLALAKRMELSAEQVMAIGDNENDISMFEVAGLSVAMENGTEHAREVADRVTRTNEEDGVALAIEEAVLSGEA